MLFGKFFLLNSRFPYTGAALSLFSVYSKDCLYRYYLHLSGMLVFELRFANARLKEDDNWSAKKLANYAKSHKSLKECAAQLNQIYKWPVFVHYTIGTILKIMIAYRYYRW